MAKTAVIGLGAMGSRMAANLLKAGHSVTVYNRTPASAEPLKELGASVAATPREAATGADFVISMVRDDPASRAVWLDETVGAVAGLGKDTVAIESSTISPPWAAELEQTVIDHGARFLAAPVSGSTPQAEAAQLVYLVGGDAETLADACPVLEALGSTIHHVGDVSAGAAMKLAVNALLGIQIAAVAEVLGMLGKSGIDGQTVSGVFNTLPAMSPAAKSALSLMVARSSSVLFTVDLLQKDLSYVLAQAESVHSTMPVSFAVRNVLLDAAAAGLGKDNMTSIIGLYEK